MRFSELTFDVLYNPSVGTYHHVESDQANNVIRILDGEAYTVCSVSPDVFVATCGSNIVFKDIDGMQWKFKTYNLVQVVN